MQRRPHAAYAVYSVARVWGLWSLPLVRLITIPLGSDWHLLWRDVALVSVVIAWSVWRWRRCCYYVEETANGAFHRLCIRQGVAVSRWLHLSADDAASVEIERTPLLWLLRCRRIRISTAGLRRRTDALLYLSASDTTRLFSLGGRPRRCFRGRWMSTVVLAVSGSNALVGVLTLVPVMRQAERLFGLPNTITDNPLFHGLPPLFRLTANVLLLSWAAAVVLSLLRYLGFFAVREQEQLHITLGVLTRRDLLIDCEKITGLHLRQTLLMRMFSLHGAAITAAGYGRAIGTRPVLVPAADSRTLHRELHRLLPSFARVGLTVRAVSQWRYVWAPLVFVVLGAALLLQGWLWRPLLLLWLFVGSWWLLIRLIGYAQAGFGCSPKGVCLCYPSGLALYRVYLPYHAIDRVTVTQHPWQRHRDLCSVQVYGFGEKRRRHRVTGLSYRQVCAALQEQ